MPTVSNTASLYIEYLANHPMKTKPKKSVQFFKAYGGAFPKPKKKTRFFQRFQAARDRCQQVQK